MSDLVTSGRRDLENSMLDRVLQEGIGRSDVSMTELVLDPLLHSVKAPADWKKAALIAAHQLAITTNMIKQMMKEGGDFIPRKLVELPLAYISETPIELARRTIEQDCTSREAWQLMRALAVNNSDSLLFLAKKEHSKKMREMLRDCRGAEMVRKSLINMKGVEVVVVKPGEANSPRSPTSSPDDAMDLTEELQANRAKNARQARRQWRAANKRQDLLNQKMEKLKKRKEEKSRAFLERRRSKVSSQTEKKDNVENLVAKMLIKAEEELNAAVVTGGGDTLAPLNLLLTTSS